MNKSTREILKKCGIQPHLIGYEYLGEAIEIVHADRRKLRYITCSLYPDIAVKFNTTYARVERAMRHAIEVAMNNLSLEEVEEIFGKTISPIKGKPTNAQFIATLVDMLED